MRSHARLTALAACLLLFAAPAAWACAELGAMASHCSMEPSSEMPACHDAGEVSMDCCDMKPAPETSQALSSESLKLLMSLGVNELTTTLDVPRQAFGAAVAESIRPPGLERYTLFSSFLL